MSRTPRPTRAALALASAVGGITTWAAGRALRSSPVRLARMAGVSIAAPDAAGWITDFCNAAYYARARKERTLDDLRLALAVVTTRWHRLGHRRLRAWDVAAFHQAFGRARLDAYRSERGTLDHGQLLEGAERLLGDWFPEAYADDTRRAWGIAFETAAERDAYDPGVRLAHARLGPLTPPSTSSPEQVWHTYPPVAMPGVDQVAAAVTRPETWPDYASELGRFTPVRPGGLDGQTFEIEVVGQPTTRTPVWLRAYVTVTRLVTASDPEGLAAYVTELNDGLARFARDEPPAVPDGATPAAAFDLTTHEGHFMGAARNRLVLYEQDGQAYLRAAGTWDPLDWGLAQVYDRFGYYAQHAFWGMQSPEESMLHQIAEQVGT